jgi:hypothetical protein
MFCGARTRKGRRCRRHALAGKRRCRLHGGLSTGPRDWRPSVVAMVAGRKRYIELRHAFGLKAPGGRPRKLRAARDVQRMAQQQLRSAIVAAESRIPAVPDDFRAALLARLAMTGLHRLEEIVSLPVDEAVMREHPAVARLVGDIARAVTKLGLRAPEGATRGQRDADLAALLAEIQADKARDGRAARTAK